MLATTPLSQLCQWIDQAPLEIGKVFRYRALRSFKKLLGNGAMNDCEARCWAPRRTTDELVVLASLAPWCSTPTLATRFNSG